MRWRGGRFVDWVVDTRAKRNGRPIGKRRIGAVSARWLLRLLPRLRSRDVGRVNEQRRFRNDVSASVAAAPRRTSFAFNGPWVIDFFCCCCCLSWNRRGNDSQRRQPKARKRWDRRPLRVVFRTEYFQGYVQEVSHQVGQFRSALFRIENLGQSGRSCMFQPREQTDEQFRGSFFRWQSVHAQKVSHQSAARYRFPAPAKNKGRKGGRSKVTR